MSNFFDKFDDSKQTQQSNFFDKFDSKTQEESTLTTMGKAFGAGVDKLQELGYRAVKGFTDVGVPKEEQTNAIGRTIGQGGSLSKWADEGIQTNIREQQAYAPSVASYKDIDSFSDVGSYVGEMTAQSVPMMAAALNPLGLFAMGGGMSNEAYETQPEDNKQPWRATVSGFGQAGLERLGVESSIGRILGGEGKNVIKRVGQSALTEGITETGQEALAQWGGGKSLDELENLDEAFVGGAAVGGTIRGGTEAGQSAYNRYRGEKPTISEMEETDLTQGINEALETPDPFADIGPAQEQAITGNEVEVIPGETAGDTQPNWQYGQNDMPYRGQMQPYTFDGEYEQYREPPRSVPVGQVLEAPIIDGEFERPRGLPNRADTIIAEDGRPMQQAQEFADNIGEVSNRALPQKDIIFGEDGRNVQVKRNGDPFGGRRAAQLTKEFRQAKEQGLNPQVIEVNGGYGWIADGDQQAVAPEAQEQNAQPVIETKSAQRREAPKKSTRNKVYTPNGRELEVEYAIVDADQLVTSNTDDGRVNPDYPQTLQPRDRTRASSEIQINSIANKLNPALLGESPTTGDGAPIISDSGIVESGNGRSLALRRAYQTGKAADYRTALIEQGYDVSGVEKPVLVRVRRTQMNDQDLVDYTKESNERSTLSLSASETAKADAKAIGNIISDFKGGDVSAAGNRDFVRKFMQGAVSQSEQASMVDGQGILSQDGRRRVEAAMIANAYDNTELVNDLFESSDNDIKSIGGALLDASGDWAKMRAAKNAGGTQEDIDITPNVIEAVNLVRRSRSEGKKISEMVAQTDLFAGDIDPTTKVVLGLFYGGDNFTKPRSRQRVKEALTRYAELASSTNGGDDLFGGELETVKPEQLLGQANAINEQTDQQAEAQTDILDQNPEPAGQSSAGDRGEGQRPTASENGQAGTGSQVSNVSPINPEKQNSEDGFITDEMQRKQNETFRKGLLSRIKYLKNDTALDKVVQDAKQDKTTSVDFIREVESAANARKIELAANEAATSPTNNLPEPTEAQKEAGNYKKGKVRLHGLDISIENPKGSTRKGKDQDGKEWSSEMKHHYGDIKGTTGADGDSIDVFIGDNHESQKVFIVDQIDPKTGEFDEVKVMMGFDDVDAAKKGYSSNYDKGWKGLGEITEASVNDFKAWTKRPRKSKQPYALPVKPKIEDSATKNQEDWGEKITTARKNLSVRWNESSTDDEISSKPLSKTWPEKEFDDIGDSFASAFAYAARSEIPRKPNQAYKKQRWVEKVKNFRQLVKDNVVDGLLAGEVTKEKLKELGGKKNLQDFFAKVDLLSELDREYWGKVERVLSYPDSMDFNPKTEKLDIPNPKTYVRINGRNREFNSTDPKVLAEQIKPFLEEKVEKPKMKFEVRGRKGSYFVNKKGDPEYTRLATFDSSKEAFDFIKNNNSKLVESWESHKARVNVTKADIRNKVNKPRTGEDYRNGKNATAEDFQNTFGIKRGTFGKWVKQGKERQDMLNGTYDALMDLANITGVPPRALSLEGKLGFAFGANGRGKAMAHYEPGEVVINLTKTKGAGSLAHEWFHALDNYFQKKRDTLPTTEKGNFITHNPETYYIGPRGYSVPESRFRDMRGINKNEWRRVEGVRPEVAESFKSLVDTLNGLDFAKRSSRLDKGKAGGYWSSNLEMAARAFESYVKAKMSANGYDNDFLANVTSDTDFVRDDNRYPYIKADEIAEVEAAFDDLFNTIESKESDNGDVALFRQGDGPTKTKVKVDGKLFETGKPVTFPYLHNKDSATKMFGIPDKESPFGRGFEPSAKYVTYHDGDKPSYGDFEAGEITFNNPLVIDNDNLNWKQALSESYGGKTGKALSKAIIKDGFDGIVTVDGKSISEIVDLTTFDESKALFSASSTVTSNTNTRTVSRSNANEIVGRFLKGLGSVGKNYVSVVSSYDDLPSEIKDAAKAQGAEYQVKGVFHKGKVHVVLDQHTSALDMETTLFHEAYGHLGIKNLFGNDITKKLNSLFVANGGLKGLRETAKRHGINLDKYINGLDKTNMPQEMKNRVLMDELLAHMQQSNKPTVKRLAKEVVGFIRQKLRDLGLAKLAKVSDSDLFYVLKQARAAANSGPTQSPGETLFRTTDDAAPFTMPEESWTDNALRFIQDKFNRVKRAQDTVRKAGIDTSDSADVYGIESLYYGKVEEDFRLLAEKYLEPMAEKMAKHNIKQEELDLFLYALHAPERNAHIHSMDEEMTAGSGMTDDEARRIIDAVNRDPRRSVYTELQNSVREMIDERTQQMFEQGLIDEETFSGFQDNYRFYVPLKGQAKDEGGKPQGTGMGFNIKGKESISALGRKSRAESPLLHAYLDTQRAITRGHKNEVGNALLNLIEEAPNPELWSAYTTEGPLERKKGPDGKIKMMPMSKEKMAALSDKPQSEWFATKRDGMSYYIKLDDPVLAMQMKNVGVDNGNRITQALGSVNRFLSMMATSANPEFLITNVTRDVQTALYNLAAESDVDDGKLKGIDVKALTKNVLKDMPKALAGIRRALRENRTDTEWSQIFDDFRKAGAKTGYFDMKDIETQSKDLQKLMKLQSKGGLIKHGKAALKFIEDYNSAVENTIRLSVYKNAIDAGISRHQAAVVAKNLTVNFNRKGQAGTWLNSLYLFANAGIQGTANFARAIGTFKTVDGERKLNLAQKAGIAMAGVGFSMALMNRFIAGEDDDGESYWDKVPEHVKERNFVLMLPGSKEYVTFPMPYGYNVFANFGTAAESVISGGEVSDNAGFLVKAVMGSFLPIGLSEGNDALETGVKTIMPQIGKPFIDLATNSNFFGSAIYSEANENYGSKKSDAGSGFKSTNEFYKQVAMGLNKGTGGSEYQSGLIDVHPETVRYMLEYIGSGASRFVLNTAETATRGAQGEFEPSRTPFIRRFYGETTDHGDSNTFYERLDEVETLQAELESLKGKERLEFRKENKALLKLSDDAKRTQKQLKQLRKRLDRFKEKDNKEVVEKIEAQIETAIDRFNLKYNEISG